MTTPGPYYNCASGAYIIDGQLRGFSCRAYNGAPAQAGFHPGTFGVAGSGDPTHNAAYECSQGVTVQYDVNGMTVIAQSGFTQVQ